ncbi:Imm21 family immunity protein [Actinoplanes sp. CA-142083]|uniref:Imm21 family immunity protein n=1 Tax=Actinoplanes sp. CA-142083 TaxID=3239903 RepID=UPI003D8D72D6
MGWVRSFGGPLILLPRDAMPLWAGPYAPDGDDEVDEEDTDYWRVSEEVQDYAEVVDVGGIEALVVYGGPLLGRAAAGDVPDRRHCHGAATARLRRAGRG